MVSSSRSVYSAGRPSARRAAVAAVVVVLASTVGAGLSLRHRGPGPGPPPTSAEGTGPFYAAVKVSMVPLLRNLQALQSTLAHAGDHPEGLPPGVAEIAGSWAEDMATARDLVGRLVPVAGPSGEAARDLFEHGAALYRESALALSELSAVADDAQRLSLTRSAVRLRVLADRVLDVGKRLLGDPASPDGGTRSAILPEAVPAFAAGAERCSAPVPVDGYADDGSGPTTTVQRWIGQNRSRLVDAVAILDGHALDYRAGSPLATTVPPRAGDLTAISRDLDVPRPRPAPAGEGSIALRLGLLVESEAECALAAAASSSSGDGTFHRAQRLRRIGDDLWHLGAGLFEVGGCGWPKPLRPTPTGLDANVVRTGGLFGGHPPPLRPGDPPDLGVPGGLQLPDPSQVLTGL